MYFLFGSLGISCCVDLAKQLVPGPWIVKTGQDIEGLPQQTHGNDCGIFMIMYTWYLILGAPFDFTVVDMPVLRSWWCTVLVENFHLEGHGRRFAHFTQEGIEMVNGLSLPVFRVERKRKPIEETNQDLWTIADHCYAKKTKLKSESKENPELLEEAVKEAQWVRQLQCAELINCMKGSTSIRKHLEAIITGDVVSAWEHRKERPTLYFEDDQLDEAVSFLFGIIRETPRTRRLEDWVDFTINVLLPEVTVHTLAIKYDMPMQEAIVRYKKGLQYEPCELKMIEKALVRNLPEDAAVKLRAFKKRMERALSLRGEGWL